MINTCRRTINPELCCVSSFILPLWMLSLSCCSRRCLEAFCIYGSVGRVEEPYVSITRKKQLPRGGQSEEVERQVGQAEGKLFTHRAAFARSSVIQAFLGSAPQLTLQLYICALQQGVSIGRGEEACTLMCHILIVCPRVTSIHFIVWADQLSAMFDIRGWCFHESKWCYVTASLIPRMAHMVFPSASRCRTGCPTLCSSQLLFPFWEI